MNIVERIQHAWNAFTDTRSDTTSFSGYGSSSPVHRTLRKYDSSSFSAAIFNRIALDVAMTRIQHVTINAENDDRTPVQSGLNYCLNTEANIDQNHIQFLQDVVYSMFDEGVVAVVPVDTDISPNISGSYNIKTMRVGRIVQWYPKQVRVSIYNENDGKHQEVTLAKSAVAIIENPLYAVINGPNATLKRLIRKMELLDETDEFYASGRLDIIFKLPYAVRSDLQKKQAQERLDALEQQLIGKKNRFGIAYTDAAEDLMQLNRPVNNQLLDDITRLSQTFYNQLGLTEAVFNGTADENQMRTYYTRTVDPIVNAILAEFNRKFLTKTARTQGHTLEYYRDPFKLVPLQQLIEMGDTFRRNEIASSNEVRRIIGMRSSNDPRADALANPNIAAKNQEGTTEPGSLTSPDESPSPKSK